MSQLSAAVVVIAVAIAAIGLGITADDAGADSEPKSRLFVVSSVLAHNTAHGKHKTYFPFSFSFPPLLRKKEVAICVHYDGSITHAYSSFSASCPPYPRHVLEASFSSGVGTMCALQQVR